MKTKKDVFSGTNHDKKTTLIFNTKPGLKRSKSQNTDASVPVPVEQSPLAFEGSRMSSNEGGTNE